MKPTFKEFRIETLDFVDEVVEKYYREDSEVFPSTKLQTIIRDIPTREFVGVEMGDLTFSEFFELSDDLAVLQDLIVKAKELCNDSTVMIYALAFINVCLDDPYARDKIELVVKYLCKR